MPALPFRKMLHSRRLGALAAGCLAFFGMHAAAQLAPAVPVVIDVQSAYGITQPGIARALVAARKEFVDHPDATVILKFAAGTYELEPGPGNTPIIEVSNLQPGAHGRLIFQGAGMDQTTLVFAPGVDWIFGRNVYRLTFADMHMAGKCIDVSQGHVVSVSPGKVVLDIEAGFPTPLEIFNPNPLRGRYLRRYTDSRTAPELIPDNNPQIFWTSTTHLSGSLWQFNLGRGYVHATLDYKKGELVGIKSALARGGGNTYWFRGGSDIAFDHVEWTGMSRGIFRGGIGKVRVSNCVIARTPPINGQALCLSVPAGGPQIGHPDDTPSLDNLVENNHFEATGDDSIAFSKATGVIRNNYIADSYARGILLYHSPNVVLQNNTVLRCPVLWQ
jgi:parallel beta-helix repeat protein